MKSKPSILAAVAAGTLALLAAAAPARAQQSTMPPISAQPVPGDLELAKMIWTTMAAIDHANQSGNYSVLRDISSPAFQIANNPSQLAAIFGTLRATRLDLSNALLLAPTYSQAPRLGPDNILVLKGFFGLRPTAIEFNLEYEWVQGKWRLFGVSIVPATIGQAFPAPPAPPAAKDSSSSRRRN